ncbi:haloacid dehalogenase-like hydrolase-like protein [Angomonas deanei]|nr:haloacid dehalogenase-like hydrolase-like protein [Angomonas deanei]|eukprot:EPY40523.1 haloacid dehalogenase-like hydrolase-like protein [Angomonas deanei]
MTAKVQNPYKLVALDMDGTLLNSHHEVSERTKYVLQCLLQRGVHVVFATGRPFTNVFRVKKHLNIFGTKSEALPVADGVRPRCFSITTNGTCIYDEHNEKVYEQVIHPDTCKALYHLVDVTPEVNLNVHRTVTKEEVASPTYHNPSDLGTAPEERATEEWIARYPAEMEALIYESTKFTYRTVDSVEQFSTENVNEIFFLSEDKKKAREVENQIRVFIQQNDAAVGADKEDPSAQLHGVSRSVRVAPSSEYCVDILPGKVSKASSIAYILQELQLTFADTIAFGDGLNDLEMLTSAAKGFVMGNANERVKHILLGKNEEEIMKTEGAHYCTFAKKAQGCELIGTNDEDGVATKLAEIFGIDLSNAPK